MTCSSVEIVQTRHNTTTEHSISDSLFNLRSTGVHSNLTSYMNFWPTFVAKLDHLHVWKLTSSVHAILNVEFNIDEAIKHPIT